MEFYKNTMVELSRKYGNEKMRNILKTYLKPPYNNHPVIVNSRLMVDYREYKRKREQDNNIYK